MAERFQTRLRNSGCDMDIDEFRDLLVEQFHGLYRAWTDEDLMHHPDEAHKFCRHIRSMTNCAGLTDELILRVLSGSRKSTVVRPRPHRNEALGRARNTAVEAAVHE